MVLSSEEILHYIWKFKRFKMLNLKTVDGTAVSISSVGLHNLDAGPDFSEAKIKIGDTLWAGNVEIHIKSSDWLKHQHQHDKAYDNVILHVVWEHDVEIKRTDGTVIPTLALKDIVNSIVIENYLQLKENTYWIPCQNSLKTIDTLVKQQCLDRMMMERLEYKSEDINLIYQNSKQNWEDTFYTVLAKSFGFKVNGSPFELLANQLPQLLFAKYKNNPIHIDALVFGVAGFLNQKFVEEYPKLLVKEYQFLKAKHQLTEVDISIWKFSKTRPDNFPTVRLGQFAALVNKSQHLLSKIIEVKHVKDYLSFFEDLPVNPYWETHYQFNKILDQKRSLVLGKESVNSILINTISPLLFFYGKQTGQKNYIDKALNLLENLKPENNAIIKKFGELGYSFSNAFDTQALIQLKKYHCDQKKCLNCTLGINLLSKNIC
jgi:hypothetical protein